MREIHAEIFLKTTNRNTIIQLNMNISMQYYQWNENPAAYFLP